MFPVDNRDVSTLMPLIEKHVAPASRIFADSWAAYLHLSDCKYPYTGCGRIVFNFSTEQAFIDFDIPVQYVEYTNSQNISLT
jgi:transposase-like protein